MAYKYNENNMPQFNGIAQTSEDNISPRPKMPHQQTNDKGCMHNFARAIVEFNKEYPHNRYNSESDDELMNITAKILMANSKNTLGR